MKDFFIGRLIVTAIVLIIIFVVCIYAASYDNRNDTEYNKISIIGEVKSVYITSNKLGIIFVEGEIRENTVYDKASITVTDETTITYKNSNQKLKLEEIRVGDIVEVEFTGPVRESYPVQADALWIKIIK